MPKVKTYLFKKSNPFLCIILFFLFVSLSSCADLDAKMEAKLNSKIDSRIEMKMKNELRIVGADMRNKIAEDLRAEFNTQLNTQNTGMFSGGAIYVLGLGIFIVASIVYVIIWGLKQLFKYKQIWHLISESIAEHSEEATVKDIKNKFENKLEADQLKDFVSKNLKKRGLNNKSKG
jgi:hypothetical protein